MERREEKKNGTDRSKTNAADPANCQLPRAVKMEFVVVAGTYEHILYGFYCLENDKDDTKQKMVQTRTDFLLLLHEFLR